MKHIVPLLITLLNLAACSHMTIYQKDPSSNSNLEVKEAPKEIQLNSYLYGIVHGYKAQRIESLCPESNLDSMVTQMNSSDVLISVATLGFYVPHRITYTCSQ